MRADPRYSQSVSLILLRTEHLTRRIMFMTLTILMVGLCSRAMAQEPWDKEGEGEIKDVEIEIVKDRKIILPRGNRNFEKVPPRPFEPIKPAIVYELASFQLATPDFKPLIRPLKLKQEEISRVYGNYLSAGIGNFASVFLEGSITTKRDKNKFLGAHLLSRSFGKGPVDGSNSASATTLVQVFGKRIGRISTFGASADFESRGGYFYGYDPALDINRDNVRQRYNIFGLQARIENTQANDLNYSLSGGYSYLQDHYQAREGETSVLFNSIYKINETSKFLLNADYFLIARKDSSITNGTRHLLRIKPSYQFEPMEQLMVTAGINIALLNDQYAGSKDFHLYPQLKAQYELNPSWEAYGIVTGDIDKVDLHTLSAENPWVDSNIPITQTNRALEFRGGLLGKIGRKVAVEAGVSVATLKNYYYYQTVRDDLNPGGVPVGVLFDKFTVVYDPNTQRFNPFAEISYAQTQDFSLVVRGDYFSYNTEVLQGAWHRPSYRISANSRYNLYEKITLEAGFIAQGGMKSLDPASNTVILLAPAFDLNFKLRYFLSKQFSAFVQFNNILSRDYPLYQSYNVRGFQVLGGVSWSF